MLCCFILAEVADRTSSVEGLNKDVVAPDEVAVEAPVSRARSEDEVTKGKRECSIESTVGSVTGEVTSEKT